MNNPLLPSFAEQQAKAAEEFSVFHGLNLIHIRRQVTHLLSMVGRDGIFDEYTHHDISHIDKMLENLDWIIPEETKSIMSPADWLMTVLAIYFHDLGMLVTRREYDRRDQSDFPRFKEEILFAEPSGKDYREKVRKLPPDRAERFLYQEFVRSKHAERIRKWVTGKGADALGVNPELIEAIDKLLEPLGDQFRRDLGLICESHHLNDINDRKKYKIAEPYGDSAAATANVQYCAVLLRTSDLLHITADRTPSITFKVINPTDPISQEEWSKQRAVKRVHPKLGLNEEGQPDEKAVKDTLQVHAYFKNENGFFALTTYLAYCVEQLKLSHQWIANANKDELSKHNFPWRRIDDGNIQTEGFLRDTFEFAIDQAKILDLLTGHTLYNDTRVVLREIVQNALDAIRIQNYPNSPAANGKVHIKWNSDARSLSVTDNGTGMSQKFISDFLLKVGTSRYQDPDFKKQYPDFSSISRFGIGVLSTFMIADSVEITTCHPDDPTARQLTLRSVHGKYLIRLLDKSDEAIRAIGSHGTTFELKVRPSVDMGDILEIAKMWIVVPGCEVLVTIDQNKAERVGHTSPASAVLAFLEAEGVRSEFTEDLSTCLSDQSKNAIRVVEKELAGVTVAYAVQWSPYFREWSFLPSGQRNRRSAEPFWLGTCIEGIRVEFQTPGYIDSNIVAIANIKGQGSPKTNVARSGIEATQERDDMLKKIYRIYRNHIADEVHQLRALRSYSLTWAIEEARYLITSLLTHPVSTKLLEDELTDLKVLPVESKSERIAISAREFAMEKSFWTIECMLLQPAEVLIREAATSTSLFQVVKALKLPNFDLPSDLVLCGVRPYSSFGKYAYQNREVDKIVLSREQRRIDLRWTNISHPPRWLYYSRPFPDALNDVLDDSSRGGTDLASILVGVNGVDVPTDVGSAIRTLDNLYIMPGTSVALHLTKWLSQITEMATLETQIATIFNLFVVHRCFTMGTKIPDAERFITNLANRWESHLGRSINLDQIANFPDLLDLVDTCDWTAFAPSKWSRKWKDQ
jgi:molecular chaperone HtpG